MFLEDATCGATGTFTPEQRVEALISKPK